MLNIDENCGHISERDNALYDNSNVCVQFIFVVEIELFIIQ